MTSATAANIACSLLSSLVSATDDFAGYSYLVNQKLAAPDEVIVFTDDAGSTIVSQRELRGGEMSDQMAVQVLLRNRDQQVATTLGMKLLQLVDAFPTLNKSQRLVTIPKDGEPDVGSEADLPEIVQVINVQRITGMSVVGNPESGLYECYFSFRVTI